MIHPAMDPDAMREAIGHTTLTPTQAQIRAKERHAGARQVDSDGAWGHMTKVTQTRDATCWVRDLEPDATGWLDPTNVDFGELYSHFAP